MKARRARFRLPGEFSGAAGATVTITIAGDLAVFSVRPLGSRTEYSAPLERVARGVIYDVRRLSTPMRAGALRPDEKTPRKRRIGHA
ncbi:MAG TPA: hypothetical protein VJV75_03710 [Candidatus Polarisedimenticolia bacterium]|nr:hypothetical protein [Candidatus Polarisedimenticolia bacterium]